MHNPWAMALGIVVASGWPWPLNHLRPPEEVDLRGLFQPPRPPAVHHEVNEEGTNASNRTNQTETDTARNTSWIPDWLHGGHFSTFLEWDWSSVLGVRYFSTSVEKGRLASEGGWILWMMDASGTTAFGDFWPWIALAALVLLAASLALLLQYVGTVLLAPFAWMLAFAMWLGLPLGRASLAEALPELPPPSLTQDVKWEGPEMGRNTDTEYYRDTIKGRGANRKQNDVLIRIDGMVARLQTDEGSWKRIDRHGLSVKPSRVLGATNWKIRSSVEKAKVVHLCRSKECSKASEEDDNELHCYTYTGVDADDIIDLASFGKMSCAKRIKWVFKQLFTGLGLICYAISLPLRGCFIACAWGCNKAKRQLPRKIKEGAHTRELDPTSESEGEDAGKEGTCQAVRIGLRVKGKPKALAPEGCKDHALKQPTRLLEDDIAHSDVKEKEIPLCSHHQKLYEAACAGRKCSVVACFKGVKGAHEGIPLCKKHLLDRSRSRSPSPAESLRPEPAEDRQDQKKVKFSEKMERPRAASADPVTKPEKRDLNVNCPVLTKLFLKGEDVDEGWYLFLGIVRGTAADSRRTERAEVEIPALGFKVSVPWVK